MKGSPVFVPFGRGNSSNEILPHGTYMEISLNVKKLLSEPSLLSYDDNSLVAYHSLDIQGSKSLLKMEIKLDPSVVRLSITVIFGEDVKHNIDIMVNNTPEKQDTYAAVMEEEQLQVYIKGNISSGEHNVTLDQCKHLFYNFSLHSTASRI